MTSPLWPLVKDELRSRLEEDAFKTWILPLEVREESDRMVLTAPSPHFRHNLEEQYGSLLSEIADGAGAPAVVVEARGEERPPSRGSIENLDPRYRFDSFVVGSSNQFAHAAARAVCPSGFRLPMIVTSFTMPSLVWPISL